MLALDLQDQELSWAYIKETRKEFMLKIQNKNIQCSDFISNNDIFSNHEKISNLMNVTKITDQVYNLPITSINRAAEMFIYLNSCPKYMEFWKDLYKNMLFNGSVVRAVLLNGKILKKSRSSAGKIISSKLRKKLLELITQHIKKNSSTIKFQTPLNHPVHVLDKHGVKSPSAFIPFCSFGGNALLLGTKAYGFDVPVCSSFMPVVQNDQLCYQIDLETYRNKSTIKEQMQSGLVLILDYNEDHQTITYDQNSRLYNLENFFQLKNKEESAQIYLDTISR